MYADSSQKSVAITAACSRNKSKTPSPSKEPLTITPTTASARFADSSPEDSPTELLIPSPAWAMKKNVTATFSSSVASLVAFYAP